MAGPFGCRSPVRGTTKTVQKSSPATSGEARKRPVPLRRGRVLAATVVCSLLSSGTAVATVPGAGTCADSRDCAARQRCIQGICQSLPDRPPPLRIAVAPTVRPDESRRSAKIAARVDKSLRRILNLGGAFHLVSAEGETSTPWDMKRPRTWPDRAGAVVSAELSRGPGRRKYTLTIRWITSRRGAAKEAYSDSVTLRSTTAAAIRKAVARWADGLAGTLTGRRGVASTRIVYSHRARRGGPKEIRVQRLSGGSERAYTKSGGINMLPSWSPSGKIAYTSFRDDNPDLYLGERKLSSHNGMNTGAAFHPKQRLIALTLSKDGNAEVYLIDARSGAIRRRLTRHRAIDTSPSWSPDGKELAFVSDRGTGRPQLFRMSARGGRVRRLPQVGTYNASPDWSPAGNTIAYSSQRSGTERYDIYSIDLSSGIVTRLTDQGSSEDPTWSRDGRYLAFAGRRGKRKGIFIMTADGSHVQRITRGWGTYATPTWGR